MFQTWLLKLTHPEVGCAALNMVCHECEDLMVELPKIVELWTEFIGVISIPQLTLLWTPNMYLLRLTGLRRHSNLMNMFCHLKLLHFLSIAIYLQLLHQILTKLASMHKLLFSGKITILGKVSV